MTALAVPQPTAPTDDSGNQILPTPHSSLVAAFRYNEKTLRLEVTLKYGAVREHWPIYKQTWLDLQAAPSKGRYYLQAIKRTNPGIPIIQ